MTSFLLRPRLAAVAALAGCLAGGQAVAVEPLAHDLRIDIPVTAVVGLGWIGSEVGKSTLAPAVCRWCDADSSGKDALNGFDAAGRSLRWSNPRLADTLSSIDAFGLLPAAVFGLDALAAHRDGASCDVWRVDALILLETVTAAAALNQLVKFAAGRERPFVHSLSAGEKAFTAAPSDNNLSFYSGHASLAFSLAVGAGTIAHLRGYRSEPVIWAVGLPLAAGVAYLRMAADKHYATDVIVGSAAGAALGFVVPSLFHGRAASGQSGRSAALFVLALPLPL